MIIWKFSDLLTKENIEVDDLYKASKGVSLSTLYRWRSETPPDRVKLKHLDSVLTALETITGKNFEYSDIMQRVRN